MSSPNVFLYLANSHERLTGGGVTLLLCFSFSIVNMESDTFSLDGMKKKNIFKLPKKIITRWAKARFVIQPFELVHFLVKKASKFFFFLSTFKIFFEHTLSVGGYFFLNHITNTLSDIVRNVTLSVSPILQLWMNTCRRTKEYGKRLNNLHAYYPCMHTCWSYGRLISLVHYASSKFFSFEHFFSSRFSNTVTTKFT